MSNIEILYGFVLEESIKLSISFFIIVFCKLIVKLSPFSKENKKSKEVLTEEKNVINVKNIKNVKHITYKKFLNNEKDLLKRIASLEKIILDQKKEEKEVLAIKETVMHVKSKKSVVTRLPKRFDPWQL